MARRRTPRDPPPDHPQGGPPGQGKPPKPDKPLPDVLGTLNLTQALQTLSAVARVTALVSGVLNITQAKETLSAAARVTAPPSGGLPSSTTSANEYLILFI